MATQSSRLSCVQESTGVRRLISGHPAFATEGYSAENTEWDFINILVIGSGGIGCELLHLLALSGFSNLTVIDLDTIELSNLNRQFLFREEDIGQPKSLVAARRVMERCPGVTVTGIFGKIEDQSDDFYRSFHFIVMGLDSVPARRWMNRKVAELATWELVEEEEKKQDSTESGKTTAFLRIAEVIPIIDTGTEGLQGHVKAIDMTRRDGSCIECQMWMYENRRKQVPMCTLENIPRMPEHCVLYVQFKQWVDERPGETLDGDSVEHVRWVTERARARQVAFGIGGAAINETFTLGVVKNVVPAVSFTNAMVAGMAVTEIMKWLTGVAPMLDNYYLYDGSASSVDVSLPGAQRLGGSAGCGVCGPRPVLNVRLGMTPVELRAAMVHNAAPATADADTKAAALQGTLSLQFTAAATGAMQEVFLVFKENSPLAVPIAGATLEDILVSSSAQELAQQWRASLDKSSAKEEAEEGGAATSGAAAMATAFLTAGTGLTISMPVRCVRQ